MKRTIRGETESRVLKKINRRLSIEIKNIPRWMTIVIIFIFVGYLLFWFGPEVRAKFSDRKSVVHGAPSIQEIQSRTNCQITYMFTGYKDYERFFVGMPSGNIVNFVLANNSKNKIITLTTGRNNFCDCSLVIDTPNLRKIIPIEKDVPEIGSSEQTIPLSIETMPTTGIITVDLKCGMSDIVGPSDCSMNGDQMKFSYETRSLSGEKIFFISEFWGTNFAPIRELFNQKGMISKSVYTLERMRNPGYSILRFNQEKHSEKDKDLQYIVQILNENFKDIPPMRLIPLSKGSFKKETAYLGDCSVSTNKNNQKKCDLQYYRFNSLASGNKPFSNKMMVNDENLEIDYIVLIPRIDDPSYNVIK